MDEFNSIESDSSMHCENTLQSEKDFAIEIESDSNADNCTKELDKDNTMLQYEKLVVGGRAYFLVPEDLAAAQYMSRSTVLQEEVKLCREHLWSMYGNTGNYPPFDPAAIRDLCQQSGAKTIFDTIVNAMYCEGQSSKKQDANENKAVAILYILMNGQSQKANWFQKCLSSHSIAKGLSGTGLSILNQCGIGVSGKTYHRSMHKVSASHNEMVHNFINDATSSGDLLVLMIDDYTNIHTKRRPKQEETSTACTMATILLKRFPGIPAIRKSDSHINPHCITTKNLIEFAVERSSKVSTSFATAMPPWIYAMFFDPERERERIEVHNYQLMQQTRTMRKMDHCRLIDEIHLPLKNFANFLHAIKHANDNGLSNYLQSFLCPQPGDWPAQFYVRQILYNLPDALPLHVKNVIPFIGPLHIQLNSRESVCLLNINFFKKAYSYIFGDRKILSLKPKAWRISLIEEIVYGGWTLIRSQVFVAFSKCKDIQYLTLLNLLDNYLPLVLSIYSVIFKSGKTEEFVESVYRCWIMFFCFRRRHYNKALLVWLGNFLFWKQIDHPLFHLIMNHLNVLDEYPVENFHSILRASTKDSDNEKILQEKARALDSNKETLSEFESTFVKPQKQSSKRTELGLLKLKGAEFIVSILDDIRQCKGQALKAPRPKGKQKSMTYWKLPSIYGGDSVVSSQVLPLGFQFFGKEPKPTRLVYFQKKTN